MPTRGPAGPCGASKGVQRRYQKGRMIMELFDALLPVHLLALAYLLLLRVGR
jgi:hypothetical protein